MRRHLTVLAVIALAIGLVLVLTGGASLAWGPRGQMVNDFRADHDRPGLDQTGWLQDSADYRAHTLATSGVLEHNGWSAEGLLTRGEAIGVTTADYDAIFDKWTRSSCLDGTWPGPCPGHRELLIDRDFTRMGVGCERDPGGRLWCVLRLLGPDGG